MYGNILKVANTNNLLEDTKNGKQKIVYVLLSYIKGSIFGPVNQVTFEIKVKNTSQRKAAEVI